MAEQPSSLGFFARLPLEIRMYIWEDCSFGKHLKKNEKSAVYIMYASKALYDEISHVMYRKHIMLFNLSGTDALHDGITVFSSRGAVWKASGGSELDFLAHGLGNFPYHKVNIVVSINRRVLHDQREQHEMLFRLWKRTCALVELLSAASALQRVTLQLRSQLGGKWMTGASEEQGAGPIFATRLRGLNIRYNHQLFTLLLLSLSRTASEIVVGRSCPRGAQELLDWYASHYPTRKLSRDMEQWKVDTNAAFKAQTEFLLLTTRSSEIAANLRMRYHITGGLEDGIMNLLSRDADLRTRSNSYLQMYIPSIMGLTPLP